MADKQPEALRLADLLAVGYSDMTTRGNSAAELRRQHALIDELAGSLVTCLLIVEHLAKDSAPSTISAAHAALAKAKEAQQ